MAVERKDRVRDTTTSTGTGTITLDGTAPATYRPLASAHTSGATVRYAIVGASEWEVGEGIWTTSGTTMSRTTVFSSSNAGALVNFSAGTKTVITTFTGTDFDELLLILQTSQSANYTLVLGDAGRHIFHPAADTTARIFTIDSNANVAYPLGTAITFINENAAGVITIAITTDTMRLAGAGTTGSRTLAANGMATAVKITATEWLINGTGLS